jgi:cell cycle protein kinase DBF2
VTFHVVWFASNQNLTPSLAPMISNRANPPSSPTKPTSGLPEQENNSSYYRDIHMDTAKGLPSSMHNYSDIRMGTAKPFTTKDDITMNTARGGATAKQIGFQTWEKELLESSEVRRKATVAQLCKSERTPKILSYDLFY